jgi:hypothetical protein
MNARNDGSPGYTDKELEELLGEDSSEEGLTSSVTVCGRITTPQRTSVSLRFPNLKIGANFRGPPALPPCCKGYALTPHPFMYAPFGVLTERRPT